MKVTDQIEIKAFKNIGNRIKAFKAKYPWIDYYIAPVIVVIILLAVYAIKSVYPFGINTIAYYDMPTNHVTGYSWLWDVYHGKKGLYLNWDLGMAVSNATGIGNTVLFPTNLFFMFVTREGILFSLSFFLLIKLFLSSFAISFYFVKHGYSTAITICAGVLYAYSGYVLQYYTNIFFLDLVIILPFVNWALERLLYENKFVVYIITMFFAFLLNEQLLFMLCLYIIFRSFFIIFSLSKEKRGKAIRLFAISMLVSALMASFVYIPSILQLMKASRVSARGEVKYVDMMKTIYNEFRRQKHFILYGSEIVVGTILLVILKGEKSIKKYKSRLILILVLAFPIIHEGINLIWHAGSYKHFPIRFGCMLTFECLAFVGEYVKNEDIIRCKYVNIVAKLFGVACLPFFAYVLYIFFVQFTSLGISDLDPYHSYWIYFVSLAIFYLIIFFIDSDSTRNFVLISMSILQGFLGCFGFVAPKQANYDNYRIQYTMSSIELWRELKDEVCFHERIKGNPSQYESNYSMITGQPSISAWSYSVSADTEKEVLKHMGYDGMESYVMDSGGTVFTDALLGITRVASTYNLDEKLYVKDSTKRNIYDCNYTLPFGILLDDMETSDDSEPFDHNNYLFRYLTDLDNELIQVNDADKYIIEKQELTNDEAEKIDEKFCSSVWKNYINENIKNDTDYSKTDELSTSTEENDTEDEKLDDEGVLREYKLDIPLNKLISLYLDIDKEFNDQIRIEVNDNPVKMDSFTTYGDYYYPNKIRNGLVALGTYDNRIKLKIYTEAEDIEKIKIGLLDMDILQNGIDKIEENQSLKLSFSERGMHVSGSVSKSGLLFFPIGYSDNWNAKVNGIKAEVIPCLNNAFISVKVPEGNVDIDLTYLPKGLILGIFLSILGLMLGAIMFIFEKKGRFKVKKYEQIIDKIFVFGYYSVVAVLFIIMYIVPIYIKMAL